MSIHARSMILAVATAVAGPEAWAQEPKGGGEGDGQVAFNTHCRTCHSMKEGDNRLGPSLHGIVGKKAGQVAGFSNYSGGFDATITWDEAMLDKLITNPAALASNTTMKPFSGIGDAAERAKIIEFLKSGGAS